MRSTPTARGRTTAAFQRAGLVVAGVLLAAALLELSVRASGWRPVPLPTKEGSAIQKVEDPELRFVNRPNGVLTVRYVDRHGAPPREVVHTVNRQGMRGQPFRRDKPPGVLRIACLGDSYTFGYGVNDEETWPAALQRLLDDAGLAGPVQILNFAVPAYETEQEVALLKKRVLDFEPDLVLLAWCINDPAIRGGSVGFEIGRPPWFLYVLHPSSEGLLTRIRAHSRAVDLVADRLHRRLNPPYFATRLAGLYADTSEGWQRCQAALASARAFLEDHDVPFVLVLYPYLVRIDGQLGTQEPYRKVREFCRLESITCLDLEPAFAGQDVSVLRAHAHDTHPNGQAHEIAAAEIARFLAGAELLGATQR